jgi:hypothetical protein
MPAYGFEGLSLPRLDEPPSEEDAGVVLLVVLGTGTSQRGGA